MHVRPKQIRSFQMIQSQLFQFLFRDKLVVVVDVLHSLKFQEKKREKFVNVPSNTFQCVHRPPIQFLRSNCPRMSTIGALDPDSVCSTLTFSMFVERRTSYRYSGWYTCRWTWIHFQCRRFVFHCFRPISLKLPRPLSRRHCVRDWKRFF